MSMLTSFCDELREKAKLLRENGVALESAALMEQAADTILELREKAQLSVAERDESYNLGFDSGTMAFMHQVEGIMRDKWSSNDTKVENIRELLDEQWREYES